MANTCSELAAGLLAACLEGGAPEAALVRRLAGECPEALLRIVVEGLADRFEPALCDTYAALMAEAIASVEPQADPAQLVERYRRVRAPRRAEVEPAAVFVLSRVTLGADVAVTSVLLDAAKRRFPAAEIHLAGSRKNWELFARDPRIRHLPVAYPGGSLRDRLAPWAALREALARPDAIVIDPDSRLTQLGLLPVCDEARYFFFESRGYGGAGDASLPVLAARWAAATFGVEGAGPYLAVPPPEERAGVAISLGVGENQAKRLPDPFEERLLALLAARRHGTLWIDRGAGGDEAARVALAIAASGVPEARIRTWEGSFAGFASIISGAGLYVGYDSAGQHVAAACGVPLVSIFAGFPAPRMFHRWRPKGQVIRVDRRDPEAVLRQVSEALAATAAG